MSSWIMNQCLVCGDRNVDMCHIQSRGAGGDDGPGNIVAMCRPHHQQQHKLGWKKFCDKHPRALAALNARFWFFENPQGIWKLRRSL